MQGRLHATITLPADKSVAQRALIACALGDIDHDSSPLSIARPSADVRSTARAVERLGGLQIERDEPTVLDVTPLGPPAELGTEEHPLQVDCGNSGTGMRLLAGAVAGLLATRPGHVILTGDESLSARPMERVAAPLRSMGAYVRTTDGHAPLHITGPHRLVALDHHLPVPSAQLLSAVALAGLAASGTTRILLPGPARDHTERMLAHLGVEISRSETTTTLTGPALPRLRPFPIPADISAAAFWMVAATVHPDADLTLPHVGLNPTRTALISVLREMGARIEVYPDDTLGPEPMGTIRVRSAHELTPITIAGSDTADLIDELPVLAVAMAGARGRSTLADAGELRVKESDRIDLTVAMLRSAGVEVSEREDGWVIDGSPRRHQVQAEAAHRVRTAGDHRIAMATVIADLSGVSEAPLEVDDRECVAVSYPGFFSDARALGY
ncbi:MAG: 3-phosphoshikimate 1-carboxyvinyltransferase [Bowdeniella nasicola]|nr:3-phosphoshikimate 1-carboxyvinyltransferase [Bowdeniella nasicola]